MYNVVKKLHHPHQLVTIFSGVRTRCLATPSAIQGTVSLGDVLLSVRGQVGDIVACFACRQIHPIFSDMFLGYIPLVSSGLALGRVVVN